MRFANIVFLQDESADEVLKIITEQGEEAGLKHLSQWDCGDAPIEEINGNPWGLYDNIYQKNNYIMSYNNAVGYAGLIELIPA